MFWAFISAGYIHILVVCAHEIYNYNEYTKYSFDNWSTNL